MRLLSHSILALGVMTLLSTSASAQNPNKRSSELGTSIRARLDANGDGDLSRDERLAARKNRFGQRGQSAIPDSLRERIAQRRGRDHGSDRDGSQGRAPRKGQHDRSRPEGDRSSPRPTRQNDHAAGKGLGPLARFDLNGDGVIDAAEVQRARALFQRTRQRAESSRPTRTQQQRPGSGQKPPTQDAHSRRRSGQEHGSRHSRGRHDGARDSRTQHHGRSGGKGQRTRSGSPRRR